MLGIRQCVVIVDLDGLKNLNDTAGHAAGTTCCNAQQRPWVDPPAGPTSLPGSAGTSSQSCSRNRTLWNRLSSCNDWRRHWWMPMSQPRSAGLSAEQASVLPRLWHRQTRGCTSKSACVAVCDGLPLLKVPGRRWSWVRALDIGTCVRRNGRATPTPVPISNACT